MLCLLSFLIGVTIALPTFSIPHLPHASGVLSAVEHFHPLGQRSNAQVPSRACGTGPPGPHLIAAHRNLSNPITASRLRTRRTVPKYTVNTYFHIVSTTDSQHLVTPAMVASQFNALEAAYASSALSFALRNITYSVNNAWATDTADAAMKTALRQGNYSALNIYFQTNLSSVAASADSQLLGYCTLPTNVTYQPCSACKMAEFPAADYSSDGCNVLAGSMPNGTVYGYSQGKTAVHEVGHWFGLLHTFQDGSCAATDAGDYIADTPQQSTATSGCPSGKDSCPGDPGMDAVSNYMDYSDDACYTGFSADQVERMQNMYQTLRYTW
ncbi:hypothetical protein MMC27_008503 [Xylographa pallens]|nr:hypothetical protein [Xylographa pallens]